MVITLSLVPRMESPTFGMSFSRKPKDRTSRTINANFLILSLIANGTLDTTWLHWAVLDNNSQLWSMYSKDRRIRLTESLEKEVVCAWEQPEQLNGLKHRTMMIHLVKISLWIDRCEDHMLSPWEEHRMEEAQLGILTNSMPQDAQQDWIKVLNSVEVCEVIKYFGFNLPFNLEKFLIKVKVCKY